MFDAPPPPPKPCECNNKQKKQGATGQPKWWNVSSGGTIQATIEMISNDPSRVQPTTTARTSATPNNSNNNNHKQNQNGGNRVVYNAPPASAPAPASYVGKAHANSSVLEAPPPHEVSKLHIQLRFLSVQSNCSA